MPRAVGDKVGAEDLFEVFPPSPKQRRGAGGKGGDKPAQKNEKLSADWGDGQKLISPPDSNYRTNSLPLEGEVEAEIKKRVL